MPLFISPIAMEVRPMYFLWFIVTCDNCVLFETLGTWRWRATATITSKRAISNKYTKCSITQTSNLSHSNLSTLKENNVEHANVFTLKSHKLCSTGNKQRGRPLNDLRTHYYYILYFISVYFIIIIIIIIIFVHIFLFISNVFFLHCRIIIYFLFLILFFTFFILFIYL